jgi:predicted transcriptional regulator
MVEYEYNGMKFSISQEAIDDLKNIHNIDAIDEIKRGIDKTSHNLIVTPNIDLENKTASLTVSKNESGVYAVDIGNQPILKIKSKIKQLLQSEKETEHVLVETIQQYRMRYIVEVPLGKSDWALDTVTMEEAKEFSQLSLGETIVSHRVITEDDIIDLCLEDNPYTESWSIDSVFDNLVTLIDDED